jgi:hypothetical protein
MDPSEDEEQRDGEAESRKKGWDRRGLYRQAAISCDVAANLCRYGGFLLHPETSEATPVMLEVASLALRSAAVWFRGLSSR